MPHPALNQWYPANEWYDYTIPRLSTLEFIFPNSTSIETIATENTFPLYSHALIWRVIKFPKDKVKKEIRGWVYIENGNFVSFHNTEMKMEFFRGKGWENHRAILTYEVEE